MSSFPSGEMAISRSYKPVEIKSGANNSTTSGFALKSKFMVLANYKTSLEGVFDPKKYVDQPFS